MRVALMTTFAASRKEPLLAMMDRIHQGFVDAGLAEPTIHFNFGDPQIGGVSSVARVLKRHPELERFVTDAPPMPGLPGSRRISNGPLSAGAGESVPYATLQEITAGVPRSFPFHNIALHFYSPEFGEPVPAAAARPVGGMMVGIKLTDSLVGKRAQSVAIGVHGGRGGAGSEEIATASGRRRYGTGRLRQGAQDSAGAAA